RGEEYIIGDVVKNRALWDRHFNALVNADQPFGPQLEQARFEVRLFVPLAPQPDEQGLDRDGPFGGCWCVQKKCSKRSLGGFGGHATTLFCGPAGRDEGKE